MPKTTAATNANTNKEKQSVTAKQSRTANSVDQPKSRRTREEMAAERERRINADFLIGCTLDERAYAVRLVRLLRDDYWMAELVRQILDKEARSRWQWTIKEVKTLLDNFDTLEALASNAQKLGNNWSNHPILKAIRKEWEEDEIADYMGDRRVQRIIESASRASSEA